MSGGAEVTKGEIREWVREAIANCGGVRAFAREVGLSPAFISDVNRGRRPFGVKLLQHFGVKVEKRMVFTYQYRKARKSPTEERRHG